MGRLAANSIVLLPRKIQGAQAIFVGEDSMVGKNSWIAALQEYKGQTFQPRIEIGAHVRIGDNFVLTVVDNVSIGDGCLFSQNVFISDHTHGAVPGEVSPANQPLVSKGPVSIGKHCFIGIRAVIMPGVVLGDFCIVGANTVVTHSFPSGSVVAGAPARLVRKNDVPRK